MTIEIQRGSVYTVERGQRTTRAGQGMLKGLGVVWRHWAKSWTQRLDSKDKIDGVFTVEYPDERLKLPEAYRNMPILLYDDSNGQELCTSCFQCQRICPPQVIHMTQAKDPATGKAVPAVAEFIIEYDACMSCGFCAEVCPFDAIKMDHQFELSTADHPTLTVRKEGLLRPVSYYQSIAPTLWDEVKESAYKKLATNMKRRPGSIGVAPQMAEKLRAAGVSVAPPAPARTAREQAAVDAAANAPTRSPAEMAAIQAAAEATTRTLGEMAAEKAAPGSESAEASAAAPASDKAARLAAIRAANAARTQPAETAATSEAPSAPAETPAPAQEKAARLAAIRAANAARAQPAEQAAAPVDAAAPAEPATPETPATAETPTVPAGQASTDEKAARLAAIRAANAARKRETDGGAQE